MVDLHNIKSFVIERPRYFTLFGNADEFDTLPVRHQEQILFLTKEAGAFLYSFLNTAHLIIGDLWNPFATGNFKTVAEFSDFAGTNESKRSLKKWLFNRGLAFQTELYVLPNYNDYPFLTTWKMIIKYCDQLFFGDDVTIFDHSLNWCLFYYHEEKLFFGKDHIYNQPVIKK